MPIYEYECVACSTNYERLQRMSDPDPPCPECNSSDVRRLISASNFELKGTGWYQTDFKHK